MLIRAGGATVKPCQPTQLEGFSWRFQGRGGGRLAVRRHNPRLIDAPRRIRL